MVCVRTGRYLIGVRSAKLREELVNHAFERRQHAIQQTRRLIMCISFTLVSTMWCLMLAYWTGVKIDARMFCGVHARGQR